MWQDNQLVQIQSSPFGLRTKADLYVPCQSFFCFSSKLKKLNYSKYILRATKYRKHVVYCRYAEESTCITSFQIKK